MNGLSTHPYSVLVKIFMFTPYCVRLLCVLSCPVGSEL